MKQVNVKNILAIFGKDYNTAPVPTLLANIQDGAWTNSFEVVKKGHLWFLECDARTVDRVWEKAVFMGGNRLELVAMKRQLEAAFVRKLHLVKADLDKWWSNQVQLRDGGKCVLCGSTDKCAAHHWYVNASRSRLARWAIPNGVWLCYGCHIRIAHERPDYRTYRRFYEHVAADKPNDVSRRLDAKIETLANTAATDWLVRRLWVEHCAP
ncbi:MAG: hypothetical protein FWH21_00600 [Kiritimatiellaeota bacterium]|nr:hypothetical protein [Kiritimatiellota bacterium]